MNRSFRSSNHLSSPAQLQQSADAQQRAADRQAARNSALTAALYRGTTNFTYSKDPAPRGRLPSVSKTNALARKRKITSRLRRNAAGNGDGDDVDGALVPHFEAEPGGDRDRGGRGGREQPRDDPMDIETCRRLPRMQAAESRAAAAPRGRFDAVADLHAAPGQEGERADAIARAWESEMFGLRVFSPMRHARRRFSNCRWTFFSSSDASGRFPLVRSPGCASLPLPRRLLAAEIACLARRRRTTDGASICSFRCCGCRRACREQPSASIARSPSCSRSATHCLTIR